MKALHTFGLPDAIPLLFTEWAAHRSSQKDGLATATSADDFLRCFAHSGAAPPAQGNAGGSWRPRDRFTALGAHEADHLASAGRGVGFREVSDEVRVFIAGGRRREPVGGSACLGVLAHRAMPESPILHGARPVAVVLVPVALRAERPDEDGGRLCAGVCQRAE